mmetsp:Transcript_30348/g.54976  ORF Transcript_30348/g.54976 Transcript_30348/m.54976 type:complete len:159 (-) Transcript_30348:1222-1698(-)
MKATASSRRTMSARESFEWQLVCHLCSIFLVAARGIQSASKPAQYWRVLWAGLWNMIVFFRPKYNQHRQEPHPEVGRLTFFNVTSPLCNCSGKALELCSDLDAKEKNRKDCTLQIIYNGFKWLCNNVQDLLFIKLKRAACDLNASIEESDIFHTKFRS